MPCNFVVDGDVQSKVDEASVLHVNTAIDISVKEHKMLNTVLASTLTTGVFLYILSAEYF